MSAASYSIHWSRSVPFLELLALAVALAMDALAVSVATGITLGKPSFVQLLRMPLAFGLFQAVMPVTGWLLGLSVRHLIERWDHWIAFALLAFVSLNMLREAFWGKEENVEAKDPTSGLTLLLLAVATSVDAMAVGLSFSLLHLPIIFPAMIIGIVCTLISAGGMAAGARLGRIGCVRCWAGVAGGVALLGIGLSILYEHGVFDAAGS